MSGIVGAAIAISRSDEEGRPNVLGTVLGVLFLGVLANGLNLIGINFYWQAVAKGVLAPDVGRLTRLGSEMGQTLEVGPGIHGLQGDALELILHNVRTSDWNRFDLVLARAIRPGTDRRRLCARSAGNSRSVPAGRSSRTRPRSTSPATSNRGAQSGRT